MEARKKDFEFLFAMKKKDSYVFTSDRNPHKSIRRETMTINLNKVMQSVSKNLPEKTKISTHSFRIGYISQLWQETKDIELVRHVLSPDHPFNYTTVRELTEEKRADLISGWNLDPKLIEPKIILSEREIVDKFDPMDDFVILDNFIDDGNYD